MRLASYLILVAMPAVADVDAAIDDHAIPRMNAFADAAAILADAECSAMQIPFRDVALAWAAASHLQMGPAEEAGRARAVLLWPDERDATRRAEACAFWPRKGRWPGPPRPSPALLSQRAGSVRSSARSSKMPRRAR